MPAETARWPRAQMIEAVERSPALVAAHDKSGWLALFTDDGTVEDPVGTAPNRRGAAVSPRSGDDDLGRFYDTFIAGNAIRFEVQGDFTAGDEVVRRVVIHTKLSTGLAIDVPAYLIYQLVEGPGGLRIRRMRAVWDLRRRSVSALGAGLRGLYTLIAVSARMFRVQGLRGVIGYTRGLLVGVFGRGAAAAERLARAVSERDAAALEALFAPSAVIELPVGAPTTPRGLLALLDPSAALRVSAATPAGWLTALCFELTAARGPALAGVAILEFDPKSRLIERARFFDQGSASLSA